MNVNGKLVLVTGASSGIGAATAQALARKGAHVLLVARGEQGLKHQAATIELAGGRASTYQCDLSDPAQIADLGEKVLTTVGVPDVVVNNAGVGRFLHLEETDLDELATMTAVPYQAALLVTRVFLPAMLERRSGWFVTINSPASRMPWPGATGYAASRWALRGFTTALRMDLRGTGIGVSEVVPGKVSSDYFANNPGAEDRIPSIARMIPTLTPEQVAEGVLKAIADERAELLFPWQLKAFEINARLTPRLTQYLSWRTGSRRPRP